MMLGMYSVGNCANGLMTYTDVATSSANVRNLSVSSATAVLASFDTSSTDDDGINWFQIDVYNIATSSIAFAFGESLTVAPSSLACTNVARIGTGTATAPTTNTFKLLKGLYLWLLDCNDQEASVDVGIVEFAR